MCKIKGFPKEEALGKTKAKPKVGDFDFYWFDEVLVSGAGHAGRLLGLELLTSVKGTCSLSSLVHLWDKSDSEDRDMKMVKVKNSKIFVMLPFTCTLSCTLQKSPSLQHHLLFNYFPVDLQFLTLYQKH